MYMYSLNSVAVLLQVTDYSHVSLSHATKSSKPFSYSVKVINRAKKSEYTMKKAEVMFKIPFIRTTPGLILHFS